VHIGRHGRGGVAGLLWIPAVFVAFWASGYLAGGLGTRAAPPLTLLFWRFIVALVVLAGLSFVMRAPWPRGPRAWGHLAVTGLLLQTTQFAGVYLALSRGTSAGLAALIVSASPLVISALAVPLFGEHLSGRQWLGLLIGLAGVAVAVSATVSAGGGLAGVALVLLGAAGFVAGTLYQKRFGQQMDLRTGGTVQLLAATAGAAVLAPLHGGFALPLTWPAVGSVAFLALVNSIAAFSFYFWLLRQRGGGAATSYLFLVPPATALLGVPILGQPVSPGAFGGIALAAVGVAMVTWRASPRDQAGPPADQRPSSTSSLAGRGW
jgi:drug/metabolite transporter (DMT)-like permease